MLKRLLVATLAAGFIAVGEAPPAVAQAPAKQQTLSNADRVQREARLHEQIARMTSLSPNEIEVHASKAVIRVVLVNTGYNGDRPSEREYLASTIAALVNTNAEKDPAYKAIVAVHVEFVKHGRWLKKTIDTVEFRRGADGAFGRHQT